MQVYRKNEIIFLIFVMSVEKYNKICQIFEDKKCKLTTTLDEFTQLNKVKEIDKIKVSFIASCNHENTVTITNFKCKSSGVICKLCMAKKLSEKISSYSTNKDQVAGNGSILEASIYKKLYNLLNDKLDIVRTDEGCNADFIIKPKNIEEDKYLSIQLKTCTTISHSLYTFAIHNKNYSNCIMILHCVSDNKTWILDGSLISHLKSKLNIGLKKSIYNKYIVEENKIYDKLLEFYQSKELFEKEKSIRSKHPNFIVECKYRLIRENKLHFIDFQYPEIQQCYYDFTINNVKVQEKVAMVRHDRIDLYIVGFGRSKKLHKVPYNYGMNKYYWVNIPDTNIFYLLPEDQLLQHNLLFESTKKDLPMLSIKVTDNKKWYNNYKYTYDTINKKDFMKLFDIEE